MATTQFAISNEPLPSEETNASTPVRTELSNSENKDASNPEAVPGCSGSVAEGEDVKSEGSVKQTVIRLKRRIDDSPSQRLVVSYKRTKMEPHLTDPEVVGSSSGLQMGNKEEEKGEKPKNDQLCSRVLRLVGTVAEDKADETTVRNVLLESSKTVRQVPKHEFRKPVKNSNVNVTTKARQRFKRSLEDGRFRLVNSKRGISDIDISDRENCDGGWQGENEKDLLKLLDLVRDSEPVDKKSRIPPKGFEPGNVTCNGVPMMKEAKDAEGNSDEKGFVYDLYVANDTGVDDFCSGPSQIVSVEEADDDFDFGEYRENAEEDECKMDDDDEDSNAEDNWRNDYPDSEEEGLDCDNYYGASGNSCFRYDNNEDGFSDSETRQNFGSLKVRDDSSSDDDLVYGIEDDGQNYSSDFTKRYARFLRRANNDTGYADAVVSSPSTSEDEEEEELD